MNEQNIFFTETEPAESQSATTVATTTETVYVESEPPESIANKDNTNTDGTGDMPVLTLGAFDIAEETATTETTEVVAVTQKKLSFEPMNFVDNLEYMGVGMLTIFIIIGVIILTTYGLGRFFSHNKDDQNK